MHKRILSKRLLRDIYNVNEDFPNLHYNTTTDSLIGPMDIFDELSTYVETFQVSIKIPKRYPFGVPQAFEKSELIIPRGAIRHISSKGEMCLDIPHKLELLALNGLSLRFFVKNVLYPYLVNQCYYSIENKFANGEYDHDEHGIIQFYREEYGLVCNSIIVSLIRAILDRKVSNKSAFCPCGSNRGIKYCHLSVIKKLKKFSKHRLTEDLKIFENPNIYSISPLSNPPTV